MDSRISEEDQEPPRPARNTKVYSLPNLLKDSKRDSFVRKKKRVKYNKMKSIVTFVCLCALWFDVGRSRILRHEKTWMRAKSRTSTDDSILQGCLSEASGSKLSGVAGATTREKQLTYFQSEFQRINTELKTVRDEMYADGGTGTRIFFLKCSRY